MPTQQQTAPPMLALGRQARLLQAMLVAHFPVALVPQHLAPPTTKAAAVAAVRAMPVQEVPPFVKSPVPVASQVAVLAVLGLAMGTPSAPQLAETARPQAAAAAAAK